MNRQTFHTQSTGYKICDKCSHAPYLISMSLENNSFHLVHKLNTEAWSKRPICCRWYFELHFFPWNIWHIHMMNRIATLFHDYIYWNLQHDLQINSPEAKEDQNKIMHKNTKQKCEHILWNKSYTVEKRLGYTESLFQQVKVLTHWGRVMYICIGKLTIIGSNNGLSHGGHQAIMWTNPGILSIGPLGTNLSDILMGNQTFSFMKMHFKMSSVKCHQFCLSLNVICNRCYNEPPGNGMGNHGCFKATIWFWQQLEIGKPMCMIKQ